jgi:hypothetical protein
LSGEWLIMGGPGAGKTTLFLALARYLGAPVRAATRGAPAHARGRAVTLVDTPSLTDDVHPDPAARRELARALARLPRAGVLHVVDAARVGRGSPGAGLAAADLALAQLGRHHPRYLMLAAKQDLPWAALGLDRLLSLLPGVAVVAVAAPLRWGLKEVRWFVAAAARAAGPRRPPML